MGKTTTETEVRHITVDDVLRACTGGGQLTQRQIFTHLGIPSKNYSVPGSGKFTGPADGRLTREAILALNYAVSSGKLNWNQRGRRGSTPILYWRF